MPSITTEESISAPFDLTLRGGTLVHADRVEKADIGILDGRIAAIASELPAGRQDRSTKGLLLLPGGVDTHVHMDQPFSSGAKIADDYDTGTASALAGGTTTVLTFVMQPRGGSLATAVEETHKLAAKARCDYSLHLTITDPTPEVLENELPALVESGHRSIKIFMTNASTRLNDRQILQVLAAARQFQALVCVHAEHHELIDWLTERLLAQGRITPASLPLAKPMIAEREAVHRIIALAEALDTPIQIFHVSGADSAEEVSRAQQRGLKVWAETCSHYFVLDANDMDRPGMEGAKFMFSPPARAATDRQALWEAIRQRVLTAVSSDHSPLNFDHPQGKLFAGPDAPFSRIPNGVPGLAARLPIVFTEGVVAGRISPSRFVELVSTAPAKIFGLYPKKGALAIDSDADIVLWDPATHRTLTNACMHHGGDYTPFEGLKTVGVPVATYLRGELAFDGEQVVAQKGSGIFLPRKKYTDLEPRGFFPAGFDPYA